MNKSILFVNQNYKYGGIERAFVNLLEELSEKPSLDITVLSFSDNGDFRRLVPPSVTTVEGTQLLSLLARTQSESWELGPAFGLLRGSFAAWSRVFSNRLPILLTTGSYKVGRSYDYAISFMSMPDSKLYWGGTNEFVINSVRATHKMAFLHCDFERNGCNTAYARDLYRRFDRIAACSNGCRKSFLRACPQLAERTSVVRNCLDYRQIHSLSKVDGFVYNKNAINVLSVGRLSVEKGFDRAIRAIAKLCDQGLNVLYHIVGDGIEGERLARLARDCGAADRVVFHGRQANPYRFMVGADLLLVSSHHEAAPMVIDEAQCLGLPVLTTETISAREMVEDGVSGWVCENSDEGIADSLTRLVGQREVLRSARAELGKRQWSNDLAVGQFMNLLDGVDEKGRQL